MSLFHKDRYRVEDPLGLSREEKKDIALYLVTYSIVYASIIILGLALIYNYYIRQDLKMMEEGVDKVLGQVQAYLTTTTDAEYGDLTDQLRHDLIRNRFCEEDKAIIARIPNQAEACAVDERLFSTTPAPYLVYLNTGESYCLGLTNDMDENAPEGIAQGYMELSFGFDEISKLQHTLQKYPDKGYSEAMLSLGSGEVSVQMVKQNFCDVCIDRLLTTVSDIRVSEAVLVDSVSKAMYAIVEGQTYTIGAHHITISQERDGDYIIRSDYISQS